MVLGSLRVLGSLGCLRVLRVLECLAVLGCLPVLAALESLVGGRGSTLHAAACCVLKQVPLKKIIPSRSYRNKA